jgi:hypothetical protein
LRGPITDPTAKEEKINSGSIMNCAMGIVLDQKVGLNYQNFAHDENLDIRD